MEISIAELFLIGYGVVVTYLLHRERTVFNIFRKVSADAMMDIQNGKAKIVIDEEDDKVYVSVKRTKGEEK